MYKLNFNQPIRIHFIGIGGISMSGLAEILMERGFTVSGSDARESDITRTLAAKGASVFYGQSADHIADGTDLVVYTAAIHPDNPEFTAAEAKNIPCFPRRPLRLAASFLPLAAICVSAVPRFLYRRHASIQTAF